MNVIVMPTRANIIRAYAAENPHLKPKEAPPGYGRGSVWSSRRRSTRPWAPGTHAGSSLSPRDP